MGSFEFDPSWVVIKALVALRLVSLTADNSQGWASSARSSLGETV